MYLTSLFYVKEILKCYPKPILLLRFTHTQTKGNISSTEHKLQYNTGVAKQDNVAQQWWYSTTLASTTISNTGKFAKMVHPDFFGDDGGRNPHHSDFEN